MERTTVANHFERNQKLMLYVGIDIAKNKHEVACINENGEAVISNFRFDNSYQGFNQLKQKLEQLSPIAQDVKIALESTGHLVKSGSSHLRHALIQAAKLLSIY
ncbi:IS110 family transposase [Streptococcus canis]|uniref:IS110 family transposase n=1 Tax=Streptococcus canis TaxID=1329 RepID=UPI000F628A6A|nr:transposase [Streptococcus canis]